MKQSASIDGAGAQVWAIAVGLALVKGLLHSGSCCLFKCVC